MYDYVDGKVDWMAAGLPVEGEDGPFVGEQVHDVPTCAAAQAVADARSLVEGDDGSVLVVSDGLVVGAVDAERLEGQADDVPLLDVMRPVPSTVRPSVTVASVVEAGGGGRVITTSEGRLLGLFTAEESDHGHDHEGHDHGDGSVDMERYEDELGAVMKAMEERFGDSEPSADEVHSFLRERLVAEGRTAEEADAFLHELAQREAD